MHLKKFTGESAHWHELQYSGILISIESVLIYIEMNLFNAPRHTDEIEWKTMRWESCDRCHRQMSAQITDMQIWIGHNWQRRLRPQISRTHYSDRWKNSGRNHQPSDRKKKQWEKSSGPEKKSVFHRTKLLILL